MKRNWQIVHLMCLIEMANHVEWTRQRLAEIAHVQCALLSNKGSMK